MKYRVTAEDFKIWHDVQVRMNVSHDTTWKEDQIAAIQAVVDGIPEPTPTANPPEWIKTEHAMIRIDSVSQVELLFQGEWIRITCGHPNGTHMITDPTAIAALRTLFADSARFPHLDLTPKENA